MVNEKEILKQLAIGMMSTSFHLGRITDEAKHTHEVFIGRLLNISF